MRNICIILMVLLTGCATYSSTYERKQTPNTVVEVSNYNWMDINVYLLENGYRRKLGFVNTNSTVKFNLNNQTIRYRGNIRFQIHLVGSHESFITDNILFSENSTIKLDVRSPLRMSNLYAY
jgi:hypothetical protein